MTLDRTTIRALAASVAMLAAGGTVAAAAAFHIPMLGFGVSGAGATPRHLEQAAVVHAKSNAVRPIRVVKTRVVDEIVHHRAAAASMPLGVPPSPVVAPSNASAVPTGTTVPVTSPPVAQPVAPVHNGDDGPEADHAQETEHDGHGATGGDDVSSPDSGPSVGGSQVDR